MKKPFGYLAGAAALVVLLALVFRSQPPAGAPVQDAKPDKTLYSSHSPLPSTHTPTPAPDLGPGVAVIKNSWPCGSTKDALDEITKWAVRKDIAEMRRVMIRTRSMLVEAGMRVKVLDSGIIRTKIRVLTNTAGQTILHDAQGSFSADPRIGRECWVPAEATR